jgi:glycosyltransferase involved in cell wall biosynthesis
MNIQNSIYKSLSGSLELSTGRSKELTNCNKPVSLPKISIITPSFNQGQFIEQTIVSIIEQNYPNLEIIIIDGGSKDNTLEVIKKYEPYITYWISEPDKGQSHAINKGLERCTGDIVNWLNSDDWLEPGALFKVAEIFKANPEISVVSGYENHVWNNGEIIIREGTVLKESLEETIEFCQIAQPSTFFRLKEFKQITPVPEDMHFIMDGELWVRFLLLFGQQNFYKLKEPVVNFRFHENSKTVSNQVKDNFLNERSSIILDLQRFIMVPEYIRNFWKNYIYSDADVRQLNRNWKFGSSINQKQLKIYFIKKFINLCFIKKDFTNAKSGVYELMKIGKYDTFLLKHFCKLLVLKLF